MRAQAEHGPPPPRTGDVADCIAPGNTLSHLCASRLPPNPRPNRWCIQQSSDMIAKLRREAVRIMLFLAGDILRRTARRLPGKTAVICGDARFDYADFNARANRFA